MTSSRATNHWIVPGKLLYILYVDIDNILNVIINLLGGGIEPNEEPSSAAIRETEEEAGVRGVIKRCLGDFEVRDEVP